MNMDVGKPQQISIAGGRNCGVAFAGLGFRFTSLVPANDMHEVGVGLQIAPKGIRVLEGVEPMDSSCHNARRPSARLMRDLFDHFSARAVGRFLRTARTGLLARQRVELGQFSDDMAEVRARCFSEKRRQFRLAKLNLSQHHEVWQ